MDDIELLEGIVAKTGDLIAGVDETNQDGPSPCAEYDAKGMVDHLVGWLQSFEAASHGRTFDGDAGSYKAGDDPAAEYRALADSTVEGWRTNGFDREVTLMGGPQPASMVFNMTVMEELTHGWDLAKASGQPVPYTEEEAAAVLARAENTLPPQFRGEGMPFGEIVEVPADAPAIDRLAGFMGRQP